MTFKRLLSKWCGTYHPECGEVIQMIAIVLRDVIRILDSIYDLTLDLIVPTSAPINQPNVSHRYELSERVASNPHVSETRW